MNSAPLNVAFLWHMHQPYYKNPRTQVYRLPWTRLHTVKDYYDMVARLEAFPRIRVTFNLVPSLIEQIADYAKGDVKEIHLELSRKKADELSQDDKISLIRTFFMGNRQTMIEPHARYRSLLDKCSKLDSEYKVHAAVKRFETQDFLDLQVWSNLAWVDPFFHADPLVAGLIRKGRHFTEEMKIRLLDKHMEIMQNVLGKYKQLADEGRIEISLSPYFHPILPLLCDSESARVAMPGINLPSKRMRFREDAHAQIDSGIRLHRAVFGRTPVGIWPPEGAISEETVRLAGDCGLRWVATDEVILEASLGIRLRDPETGAVERPDLLYRPHKFRTDGGEVTVFFRDRMLSDLISFAYMDWPAEDAVEDFVGRLERIHQDVGEGAANSVILVALDGENCWEFYDRDGETFLTHLYGRLSEHEGIRTVMLSEALDMNLPTHSLDEIYPGSWIGGNFAVWIGHSEDNKAWNLIDEARSCLIAKSEALSREQRESAWRGIYAAQGSDWFWWYGEEHSSEEDPEFDALFRANLMHVYETLGMKVPPEVYKPIKGLKPDPGISLEPAALIKPVLDGKVTTFYEWRLAGLYESYRDGPGPFRGGRVLNAVYFGFDHDNLYLRLDTSISPQALEFTHLAFTIEFQTPAPMMVTLRAAAPASPNQLRLSVEHEIPASEPAIQALALETVEASIPFEALATAPGESLSFRIGVLRDGQLVTRRPLHQAIHLRRPTPDFETAMWSTL